MTDFPDEEAAVPYDPEADGEDEAESTACGESDRQVERVRQRHEERLMAIDGVEGVGSTPEAIVVLVRDAATARKMPREIDGVAVEAEVIGEIQAY